MKTVIMNFVLSICKFVKAHTITAVVTGCAILVTAVGTPAAVLNYRHHQDILAEEQRKAAELAEQEAVAKAEAEAQAKAEAEAAAKAEAEQKAKEEGSKNQETAMQEEQKTETSQESEKNPETTNTSNKDNGSTSSQTVVQTANTDTGISWDGKSPIVYTYTDGTTGTTPKDGATYEVVPGCIGTYEAPSTNTTSDAADGICHYCGKKEWDGTNGTCFRPWAFDATCSNCGAFVPINTCHTCASTITEKFSKAINEYEYKNIETSAGSNDYIAWMSVYYVNDDSANKTAFENKFKSVFGFVPTSNIQINYIGNFVVDGYQGAQTIYQYTVEDKTYPLITDEFYVVKKKICADGSGWCGFPIPCSMDNMDNSQRVQNLLLEMRQTFCEWYGIDYSYVTSNSDKFMDNMISEAGLMRTEDGRVVDVIYRYIRGVNMPI